MEFPQKDLGGLQTLPLTMVRIHDQFWNPRLKNNREVSLFSQYQYLVKSGALENFKNAGNRDNGIIKGNGKRVFQGLYFTDSDVYKWLEAASFSIVHDPDAGLDNLMDEMIALIAAAQEENGYLNTYFQLVEPDKKFTNFGVCHELYTAGHLLQAAVAHYHATRKTSLLNIALRLADHLVQVFGPGKLEAFDGHAEIEMSLVCLYRLTGTKSYLELAEFFIDRRGGADSPLRKELLCLDEIGGKLGQPGQNNKKHYGSYEQYDGRYGQDHLPARSQHEVVGHAVRAMYLYCGMADVAVETGDSSLLVALEHLWQHLSSRRMFITGGIGSTRTNEGFTYDYDLPNDSSCAESCAAVGLVMWNQRMLQITGNGRYGDLMERVLYNAFLVGVSLDGRKYFYNNQLQSKGDHAREEWYECACCPPNIARLLASLNAYIYLWKHALLVINLYIQSTLETSLITGERLCFYQDTRYPWEGKVKFTIEVEHPVKIRLLFRIPEWCRCYQFSVNKTSETILPEKGYAVLERIWNTGDQVELNMEMPIQRISAHPVVSQDFGRVALQRGPIVYCLEDADHQVAVDQIILPSNMPLQEHFIADLLGGIMVIEGGALKPDLGNWDGLLYRPKTLVPEYDKTLIRAIPYYCWGNREKGAMTVWIWEK